MKRTSNHSEQGLYREEAVSYTHLLIEKKGKAWVDSFSIAGSMIIGMTAAVLVGLL